MAIKDFVDGISFVVTTDDRENRRAVRDLIVESIEKQNIPEYEIIFVGKLNPSYTLRPNCCFYPAEDHAENGWVTRMMNAGCLGAVYSLVVMMHDDVILADDFWDNLKENEGDWDFLAPKYIVIDGIFRGITTKKPIAENSRWTIGGPKGHRHLQENEEWDEFSYVSGESLILWRDSFLKNPWNQDNNHKKTRGTIKAFDVEFGHNANAKGLITGYDPNVKVYCLEPQ